MRSPSRASVFAGFAVVLALAVASPAQTPQTPAVPDAAPSAAPSTQGEQASSIRILYTGKTFGYFRIPDWQGPNADGGGCTSSARQNKQSEAAAEFDELLKTELQNHKTGTAVLLGTGDNFAPEIEARDFCEPPAGQPSKGQSYQRVGKELFDWDAKSQSWIRSDSHTEENSAPANGLFMIPTDNVANFFVNEGYAALVPGKQDFYFGPERVRELARYMATQLIPSTGVTLHNEGEGVQMLGANIVIETQWNPEHAPLPDRESPPWFIPRFPTAADLIGDAGAAEDEIRLTGLTDGAKVYPWFRGVSFDLAGANESGKLLAAIRSSSFYLCEVNAGTPGEPDAIPQPVKEGPCQALEMKAGEKPAQFLLDFPWRDSRHFSTLRAGANYGLCTVAADAKVKAADGSFTFCVRFRVYTPFFQSSGESEVPKCSDLEKLECYRDPDPYVLLETKDANGIPVDLAIFGVVDPQLNADVGLLNFAWSNTADKKFKTGTAVLDPAEALKEMLDSFDREFAEKGYAKEVSEGSRRLVKVLLAQMNPEEAQILGTRMKVFQVVVSAADQETATVGNAITSEWNAPGAGSVRHPMVLSVPQPYYVDPGPAVDIGSLDISIGPGASPKWTLVSDHWEPPGKPKIKQSPKDTATAFWSAVAAELKRDCLPEGINSKSQSDEIEALTLCEMQNETHADVGLLQKRDFFTALPRDSGDIEDMASREPGNSLQQLLDRILWKGDFLILLYVPGSALQQAMKQSKSFDALDRSELSIGQDKNRGFISAGITFDAEHGEYLIDGIPLDPKKLYSVVTSDFVGGGDTGYPDLAAAQMRPPAVPTDFDKQLMTISGVVCRGVAGENWPAHCIGPIDRDSDLDQIGLKPTYTGPSSTPGETLREWSIFHRPHAIPGGFGGLPPGRATLQSQLDQLIEYRPLWDFQLMKATFGVTSLGHNGSDAQIDSNFGGITTPGVNAHRFTNWTSDFQLQLTRNWKRYQFFARPAYSYNIQNKGQSNAARQVNQVANLATFDLGFARLWDQRGPEHLDLVLTAHYETPLVETFTQFTLKNSPPGLLQFSQPRSNTSLFRGGVRWQRRVSSIEFGPEGGHQWDAVNGFEFFTNGSLTATCLAVSNLSFSTCVSNDSNPKITIPPTITPNSTVTFLQGGRDHAGLYWRINLYVPLYSRISYAFTDTGDWFFVHFGSENTTDTLFRDFSQHQLKFTIFPSLSIGPELDLLLYENKSSGTLGGSFLRQDQIMMKAQFGFDLFNRRKNREQIEYAPASKS